MGAPFGISGARRIISIASLAVLAATEKRQTNGSAGLPRYAFTATTATDQSFMAELFLSLIGLRRPWDSFPFSA